MTPFESTVQVGPHCVCGFVVLWFCVFAFLHRAPRAPHSARAASAAATRRGSARPARGAVRGVERLGPRCRRALQLCRSCGKGISFEVLARFAANVLHQPLEPHSRHGRRQRAAPRRPCPPLRRRGIRAGGAAAPWRARVAFAARWRAPAALALSTHLPAVWRRFCAGAPREKTGASG